MKKGQIPSMSHSPAFIEMVNDAKSRIEEISISEVTALQKTGRAFHFVDTREDKEWEAGHLPGSIHIGKGVIERDVETKIPDKKAQIVLYCGGGFRSALAADALQKMGYSNVKSMAGGYREWVTQNLPITKN